MTETEQTSQDPVEGAVETETAVDAAVSQESQTPQQATFSTEKVDVPEEASSATEATQPGMKWYVLRVASNKEGQVRKALDRKIAIEGLAGRVGRVLVPSLKEKKKKGGVLRVVERKLYPGYVFVEMACEEDGSIPENVWFLVKETTGVGDFIGSDGKPTSMSEDDVVQMVAASQQAEEEPGMAGLNIHKGEQVKITDGAFESYEGEVDSVDEKRGMVSVIVTIFGRSTPIEVDYWQLEKVE